ncbi:MAG TPA: xanthine dehydrogenase family protein molybdopterin-binding subunit [Gaiellaceae bacterium]|nr:xanthine dehydrogenase family protein molybdopterin-binding subunit [Gaiellaceae bacterium]
MSTIGQPVRRREDERFLTGAARYIDDIDVPEALHAAFVRSFEAHARIRRIDVAAARRAPGVAAVLTGADVAPRVGRLPAGSIEDGVVADAGHPVLARDKVRYAGEAVAVVVAQSRALAEDAAELVELDLEPLPPVLDARTALDERSPLLHDALGDNVLSRWSRTAGDVEGAFAHADRVVSCRLGMPRLVAAPMEARGGVAAYDAERDLVTVWTSSQDPHRPLAQLAFAFDRPTESFRVVLPDVGGAFGSKGAVAPEVAAIVAASMELERPVRWTEDRLENFLAAYQGRGLDADVELALAADGSMLAIRARLYADLGAYLYPTTAVPSHTTAMLMTGAYRIPAAQVDVFGAATSKVPTGPYRGAGRPEAAYLVERVVDLAARELGIDPVELRRRNLIPADAFPYETPLGWTYDSGDYERCLDRALELLEPERWEAARAEGRAVGVGVGMYIERCGGLWESGSVEARTDGKLIVRTGSSPHGQGHETVFAQIAAAELGVDPADVEVRWGDTDETPSGVGTFASRSVAMGGSAVLEAARALKKQLRESDVRPLRADARFESQLLFSSGAYAAAVEIDRETGAVRVLRLVGVDDPGTIVNPLLAEGQVLGAMVQGLGECFVEEAVHDENGQLRTASFADYTLLTAAEVPPLRTAFVETPSPFNPLGAKGIGEGGAIATPPAIANAVADALAPFGVRHLDPPYTEERLWRAMHEEEG